MPPDTLNEKPDHKRRTPSWTIGRAKTATHAPKAGGEGGGGQVKIGVVDGGRHCQPVSGGPPRHMLQS
jgi:hypothetical protein